jgi:hypothetical protein
MMKENRSMAGDNNQGPSGFFPIFGPDEHGQQVYASVSRIKRACIAELERVYEEAAEHANYWNTVGGMNLNGSEGEELLTLDQCTGGLVRNGIARRTARKISKLIAPFDAKKAHHYAALGFEHSAACERWQARIGAITGVEHSHEPESVTADDAG